MSEEKIVSFKTGDIKNLDALPKSEGQLLFSTDGAEGIIYFDKDANTRIPMNKVQAITEEEIDDICSID
jgi:hypothetical protein